VRGETLRNPQVDPAASSGDEGVLSFQQACAKNFCHGSSDTTATRGAS
jgi:hypothetical protein